MEIVLSLVAACACVAVFKNPIRDHAWVFYLIALAADLVFLLGVTVGMPPIVWRTVILLVERCQFAMALLIIVMFVGVFPLDSSIRKMLSPIRAELSIIAAILVAGHTAYFIAIYASQFLQGFSLPTIQLVSLAVALILTVLLVVLTVTSFNLVKRKMSSSTWKAVQRWSYLFFILIYVHVVFILMPPLALGVASVRIRFVVYSLVFGAYIILRTQRALKDKRQETQG